MNSHRLTPVIDLPAVRRKMRRAESMPGAMGPVWEGLRRMAYANPEDNPWFTPFVAAVEQDEELAQHAKNAIDEHLNTAEKRGSSHYLFNIWCFAFPHCRWALWFDLLRREGFYDRKEAERQAARFLLIQHRDHHAGLRVKPHPECVDNQAASLCLSSAVIGSLFASAPGGGHLARFMRDDAARRLESMIGGMPNSGYSGEGSTYQGRVVAFTIPFLVEMLERLRGEKLFDKPLRPNGTSAADILRMTSRLWMPDGLLLPWDDYGYQFGLKFPLAYLAHRTGDEHSLSLLEHVANWSRMAVESGGWGFDEVAWTLAFWPLREETVDPPVWSGWAQEELGGCVVSPDGSRYLMQMWDPTGAMCTRAQVNPNSLVLEANRTPLTADGAKMDDCEAVTFEGAVHRRAHGKGQVQEVDLSKGCAGAHNCILVDGWEAMRPSDDYERSWLVDHDTETSSITGDVTGLYRDVYPDCRCVRRRSRLVKDHFWLVEDYVAFDGEHDLTSRWYFRPEVTEAANGIDLQTPEGVGLQMRSLLDEGRARVERIDGFPKEPEACSDRVDYQARGRQKRWLWLLWPVEKRKVVQELTDGWRSKPLSRCASRQEITDITSDSPIHPGALPWIQDNVPVAEAYGFHREVDVPAGQQWYLRLPRSLGSGIRVWMNDTEVERPQPVRRARLLPTYIPCPRNLAGKNRVEISILMPLETGQINGEHNPTNNPDWPVAICQDRPDPDIVTEATYADGAVHLASSGGMTMQIQYELMAGKENQ